IFARDDRRSHALAGRAGHLNPLDRSGGSAGGLNEAVELRRVGELVEPELSAPAIDVQEQISRARAIGEQEADGHLRALLTIAGGEGGVLKLGLVRDVVPAGGEGPSE